MLERRSDRDLKQRILNELKWDSRVKWASINVEVIDGVVTLIGSVSSYAQKIAAQDAAHPVAGVLDVANDIEVKPVDHFLRITSRISSGRILRRSAWSLTRVKWMPQIEVLQNNGQFMVRADLPGLTKDDVKVEVTDNVLTVSGERKAEKEEKRAEIRQSGCVRRRFSLGRRIRLFSKDRRPA